jgi:hypothetical protein
MRQIKRGDAGLWPRLLALWLNAGRRHPGKAGP